MKEGFLSLLFFSCHQSFVSKPSHFHVNSLPVCLVWFPSTGPRNRWPMDGNRFFSARSWWIPICRFQRFSVREAREVAATVRSGFGRWCGCLLMEKGIQNLSNVYITYILYIYIHIMFMYIIIFLLRVFYMYIKFECDEMFKKTSVCAWKCWDQNKNNLL